MGREKWSSLVWLGLALFICIGSLRLSVGSFRSPGPGLLPFICGAILGVLSLIVHFQARWSKPSKELERPFWTDKNRAGKAFLTFIALLAFANGMDYLGFLVSSTIFLGFLLWAIQPQKWYVVISTSVLASLSAYIIFERFLNSPLPKGFWEF